MLNFLAADPSVDAAIRDRARGLLGQSALQFSASQLADHVIMTPDAVTGEMVQAAVVITGKGGTVTITVVGHLNKCAVHVHAGLLIGYVRQIQAGLFGDSSPFYDIPMPLGLYKPGQLKLDELVTRKYSLDQVNQAYQDMNDGKNIRSVIIHEH